MSKIARGRVVIEGLKPEIDGNRLPIKWVVGDKVVVEMDSIADGDGVPSSFVIVSAVKHVQLIELRHQ